MPEVGFEPTRTKRPAELESAPLDHSGIQAFSKGRGSGPVFNVPGWLVAGRATWPGSPFPWPNWIRRLTTNQKIRGSSPLGNDFLCFAAGGVPS